MVRKSEKFQYYAAVSVNLMAVLYGMAVGWTSASFLILQSDESPLETGPMNNDEISWVGSILCIGGLLGNLFYIWLSEQIGSKLSILLLSVPAILSWILIIFAKNVTYLCVSRFLAGLQGGGAFAIIPIFVTEISEDKIRGKLGSYVVVGTNLGVLVSFILGYYLQYYTILYISLAMPILFVLPILFIPETPQRLLKSNKIYEAERSLQYFRNITINNGERSEIFLNEMEKLKSEYYSDNKNNVIIDEVSASKGITLKDLTNRVSRKAFIIGLALMAINQFSGCFAMINYTGTIFKISGSNLSANLSAIIVGIIQLFGAYVSSILVEKTGRKILMIVSGISTGCGLTCLGLYIYLNSLDYDLSSFNWIPVASFSFVIFTAALGVISLTFLILAEIMPPKIRSIACMICMTILWAIAFFALKLLPILADKIGLHSTLFIFAICSFAGVIFVLIYMPETKGKSIQEILEML